MQTRSSDIDAKTSHPDLALDHKQFVELKAKPSNQEGSPINLAKRDDLSKIPIFSLPTNLIMSRYFLYSAAILPVKTVGFFHGS